MICTGNELTNPEQHGLVMGGKTVDERSVCYQTSRNTLFKGGYIHYVAIRVLSCMTLYLLASPVGRKPVLKLRPGTSL
jgi:hypothetical protein